MFHTTDVPHNLEVMSDVTIDPISKPFIASMTPPGSKSLTNRALVLACLAEGRCELNNVLFADDTLVMLDCLARLGFNPHIDRPSHRVTIHGQGGRIPTTDADLFCGNSGTTLRFLTALCTLGRGKFNLDGIPRMRQRPVGELVDLLKNLGGRIRYAMAEGFPPLIVDADGLPGGLGRFGSAASSQYLSAVLQVAPYARNEVRIDLVGAQTSWPYVAMTMRLMDEFGQTPEVIRDPDTGDAKKLIIPRGAYRPTLYQVEPDASNASYFLAAAAIHPGSRVTIGGLGKQSIQGDVKFGDVLRRMGVEVVVAANSISATGPNRLAAIDVDMSEMPDTAQTLAVMTLFADAPSRLRGLQTLRVKETDRVTALTTELGKLGTLVQVEGDDLLINPPPEIRPAAIATYDDHRMAMSFAVAGTRSAGITILDAECVNKTYPTFFDDLRNLTQTPANHR